ncbi:MAG: right-handed parallel beta-helix repeat-containing protein [Spirochaetia bacterium]|jgi:hypothetical protein|nr:right-handed parallel beta-helix repeat-containing protein [Spirochaetia bacterium]
MSARRLVLAVALFLALSPLAAQQVHRVTTVAEFVQALGPDRVVELAPGRYILSDGYGIDNPAVRWVPVDGGMELQIADSSGLTIRGQGAELVADTPYARTLGFHRGTGLVLEGLTLGHKVSGPCSAGVLGFSGMQDVRVVDCDLYGSGSIGIEISDSLGVEVSGGTIRECTAGAVWIEDSDSVFFDEVSIVRNEGSWPLLGVYGSNAVYFSGCSFSDNQGSEFLYFGEGTLDWGFEFCDFAWNDMETLTTGEAYPYFHSCTYMGNSFDDDLEWLVDFEESGDDPFAYWNLDEVPLQFMFPAWMTVDELAEGALRLSDEDDAVMALVFKTYALGRNEDPDTQADRVFSNAFKAFGSVVTQYDLRIVSRRGAATIETEAHPYHYEVLAAAVHGNAAGEVRIRLVHAARQVWAFVVLAPEPELVEPDSLYGMILDSVSYAEGYEPF